MGLSRWLDSLQRQYHRDMRRPKIVTDLRSLRPEYREVEHHAYVTHLGNALQTSGEAAPRNIALTGAYGTGKSSVLLEIERIFRKRVTTISFSTLSGREAANARGVDKKGRADSLLNLIQKEIVKQLLYRESPAKMRSSRFARVHRLRRSTVALVSLLAGGISSLIAYQFDALHRFRPFVPENILGQGGALYATAGLVVAIVATLLQVTFSGRLRLRSVSAGSATIELDADSRTYFDQYLDEIIYFFEVSKSDIVLFEDLDRFKDSGIFEELRALNTVLANAKQLRRRPVRFVYAVRDSLFEDWAASEKDDIVNEPYGSNRAKFFDLIIPMVPFITHQSARDHLKGLLKDARPEVSQSLIQLVASRTPDMRLLKNITNEYIVFASVILGPAGVQGLSADRLFALVTYKNTNLFDYEEIQSGNSNLDKIFAAQKRLIALQRSVVEKELSELEDDWTLERALSARARPLGSALGAHVQLVLRETARTEPVVYAAWDRTFSENEISSADFWQALVSDEEATDIRVLSTTSGRVRLRLSRADLTEILGDDYSVLDTWRRHDRTAAYTRVDELRSLRQFLNSATLATLLTRDDLTVDGETMSQLVERLGVDDLARELLAGGFIDEYYILYISRFHDQFMTANAKAFELQVVRPGTTDMRFRLASDDVVGLIAEVGEAFLSTPVAYNLNLVAEMIHDARLDRLFVNLGDGGVLETAFIEAFIREGRSVNDFLFRLAPNFPRVFRVLSSLEFDHEVDRAQSLNAALEGASAATIYEASPETAAYINAERSRLAVLVEPLADDESAVLAGVFGQLGVEIADLSTVSPGLARELGSKGLFKMSADNLRAASGQSSLALDVLLDQHPRVFDRIRHDLGGYLALMSGEQREPVVSARGDLALVLSALRSQSEFDLSSLIRLAAPRARASTLDGVAPQVWPDLARGSRFDLNVPNLDAYITAHGVDASLTSGFTSRSRIEISSDDDPTAKARVAVALINARQVKAHIRVALVKSLRLEKFVDPVDLEIEGGDLVARLVSADILPDSPASFARLPKGDWKGKAAYIDVSRDFAQYLTLVDLSLGEVEAILAQRVGRAALVDAILLDFSGSVPLMSRTSWRHLARFLVDSRADVDSSVLTALARQQVAQSLVLELYFRGGEATDDRVFRELLSAFGEPYSLLLEPGNSPVFVPNDDPHRRLAERSLELELVSSISEDVEKERIRMNRRKR